MQASYGGEDAFFISQQGSTTFGVADGVGGWANSGVNPAGKNTVVLSVVVLLSSKGSQSLDHCSLLKQIATNVASSPMSLFDRPFSLCCYMHEAALPKSPTHVLPNIQFAVQPHVNTLHRLITQKQLYNCRSTVCRLHNKRTLGRQHSCIYISMLF